MPQDSLIRYRPITIVAFIAGILSAVPAPAAVLPADPNNAALLYYQAFLYCPDAPTRQATPGPESAKMRSQLEAIYGRRPPESVLYQVEMGGALDEVVRDYIERCHKAIAVAETAARLPHCDWGTRYSEGFSYALPHLEPMRVLSQILCTDARILAADGSPREAVRRCLVVNKLAEHVGAYTNASFAVGLGIDKRMHLCLRHILAVTAPDTEFITWLEDQLAPLQTMSRNPRRPFEGGFELLLRSLRMSDKTLAYIRSQLAQASGNDGSKDFRDLTDDELVAHVRISYRPMVDRITEIMASDMPYERACDEIQHLLTQLAADVESDPIAKCVMRDITTLAGDSLPLYTAAVRSRARLNAFYAALKVYRIAAQTKTLPETLPAGVPNDPLSGRPFAYERSENGFTLRCRAKPIGKRCADEFDFTTASR